jgi:hypothetical protein
MSTHADEPGDWQGEPPEKELVDEPLPGLDGAYSDEIADPAMAPVIEAGGGVSEGFEQSEALLVDHATSGLDGTTRILRDAGEMEAEPDTATYGEADEERSSERAQD